jgi:hypothetical protein
MPEVLNPILLPENQNGLWDRDAQPGLENLSGSTVPIALTRRRFQAGVISQQRDVACVGQKVQDFYQGRLSTPHLSPERPGAFNRRRQELTEHMSECC